MNGLFCALLAVLSIWEYPPRQVPHVYLRGQLAAALRTGDTNALLSATARGISLFPEDPTWRYNRACALARVRDREAALDALEKAIDLGFRDTATIRNDADFGALVRTPRFNELLEYAVEISGKPLFSGPHAGVPHFSPAGTNTTLEAHNLNWNFEAGLFEALLRLTPPAAPTGNTGDLYVNRDRGHSMLNVPDFPGLTWVRFPTEARGHGLDVDLPLTLFPRTEEEGPYPVFGNVSRALVTGPYWRSLPRALVTTQTPRLPAMARLYLSNQTWVFPACDDLTPPGTNGDVFASITPYCLATRGRSWSDQYYLRAALEASRSFQPEVKREIVRRGLLAPTIQTLLRQSLRNVTNEVVYLSSQAHPTALPPGGLDLARLKRRAERMTVEGIPPLAGVRLSATPPATRPAIPELTYATPFAVGYVLRAADTNRTFEIAALSPPGAKHEFAFALTRDDLGAARMRRLAPDRCALTIDRTRLTPTNRVDVAVFAKTATSCWSAPSYLCFAVLDPAAPYCDPILLEPLPPGLPR